MIIVECKDIKKKICGQVFRFEKENQKLYLHINRIDEEICKGNTITVEPGLDFNPVDNTEFGIQMLRKPAESCKYIARNYPPKIIDEIVNMIEKSNIEPKDLGEINDFSVVLLHKITEKYNKKKKEDE